MSELEAATALLSYYQPREWPQNGSFANTLIQAFEKADMMNKHRLLMGFPEFSEPLRILQSQGIEELAKFVNTYHG